MANFIMEAKRRIRMARNRGQLDKTFDSVCDACASKNLTNYECDTCPLAQIYETKKWVMATLEDQYKKIED